MTYIPVTEAQSNPFAPGTSELFKQLRDNPIAIAGGLAGAPRVYLRALEQLTAGGSIRSRRDDTVTISATPDLPAITSTLNAFGFIQYGTIRASAEKTTALGTLILTRTRNGVGTVLLSTASTGVQNVDAAVMPGDSLSWALAVGAGLGPAEARNARFSTGGEDLWPGALVRLEGNRDAV